VRSGELGVGSGRRGCRGFRLQPTPYNLAAMSRQTWYTAFHAARHARRHKEPQRHTRSRARRFQRARRQTRRDLSVAKDKSRMRVAAFW